MNKFFKRVCIRRLCSHEGEPILNTLPECTVQSNSRVPAIVQGKVNRLVSILPRFVLPDIRMKRRLVDVNDIVTVYELLCQTDCELLSLNDQFSLCSRLCQKDQVPRFVRNTETNVKLSQLRCCSPYSQLSCNYLTPLLKSQRCPVL